VKLPYITVLYYLKRNKAFYWDNLLEGDGKVIVKFPGTRRGILSYTDEVHPLPPVFQKQNCTQVKRNLDYIWGSSLERQGIS